MSIAIKVENLSKQYRLGQIGTGSIAHDVNRWWHTVRGKEDPYLKIGETNDRTKAGNSEYVWSLKDINFEIQQGDAVGIIGSNGAGKSTLLKILSRVTSPTIGTIKTKGRIASLLEVGTGFHPDLSGRENIFLNGAILGMRKAEIKKRFDEIVDFAGVERYIDTPVKRYSSGMYVRLAFAVAAYLESEILIVDEVLAVGDSDFQRKCLGKMEEVSKGEGKTVLFVSHNMQSILTLCSQCLILKNGGIENIGDTNKSISLYLNSLSTHIYNSQIESLTPRFIRASFIDSFNNEIEIIEPGKCYSLRIEISNPEEELLEVQLSFWDGLGTMLWSYTNDYFEEEIILLKRQITLYFNYQIPYINADTIYVHLGLSRRGHSAYEMVDHVINAISLKVSKSHDYKIPPKGIILSKPKVLIQ